jgi:hypothetical protein
VSNEGRANPFQDVNPGAECVTDRFSSRRDPSSSFRTGAGRWAGDPPVPLDGRASGPRLPLFAGVALRPRSVGRAVRNPSARVSSHALQVRPSTVCRIILSLLLLIPAFPHPSGVAESHGLMARPGFNVSFHTSRHRSHRILSRGVERVLRLRAVLPKSTDHTSSTQGTGAAFTQVSNSGLDRRASCHRPLRTHVQPPLRC